MISHGPRPQVNKDTPIRQDILRAEVLSPMSWSRANPFLGMCRVGTMEPPEFILYCTMRVINNPGLMTLGLETSETGQRCISEDLTKSGISLDSHSDILP